MSNAWNDPIRISAARLRLLVFFAMASVVLIFAAARLDLQLAHAHVEYRLHGTPYEPYIALGSIVLLVVALFRLTQMLSEIARAQLFGVPVIRHFRGFALWLLLMAVFEFVAPLVAGVLGAGASRPHMVRITIDLRDVLTVGITLLLFLLARLLERARRLDEEMREFV
jgi:hypothetical protein